MVLYHRRSIETLELMRYVVACLWLCLAMAFSASANQPPGALSMVMYGGTPEELAAMLEPVLARHEFQRTSHKSSPSSRALTVDFVNPSKETISLSGSARCVYFHYYPAVRASNGADDGAKRRATDLRQEIRKYFSSLPTPRPSLEEDHPGWSGICPNEF